MANELTITKEQTARFVHDAVEMETAIFTLDRAIAECEKKKKESQYVLPSTTKEEEVYSKIHSQYVDANKKYNIANNAYNAAKRWKDANDSSAYGMSTGAKWAIGIILSIVSFGAIYLIALFTGGSLQYLTFLSPVCYLFGWISVIIINKIFAKSNHKKELSKKEKELKEAQKLCDRQRSRMYKAKEEADIAKQAAKQKIKPINDRIELKERAFTTQISDLRAKRNQVQSTLSRFYDLGVIPPDYRYMDCAIMLDQIFRNDLADTMREAIKIYDERVYRGEVIKGIDRICSMLGNLSVGMMAIEQRLSSIDSNVKMMSQDLYNFSERIAQGQAKQQKATEELLKETEMSRYATEQLAQSTKNLEWHERRRQGWV